MKAGPERRKVIEETRGHCARARPCIEYLPVELHCLEEGHHLRGLRPGHGVHGLKVLAYPRVLFFGSLVNRAFQDPSTGPQTILQPAPAVQQIPPPEDRVTLVLLFAGYEVLARNPGVEIPVPVLYHEAHAAQAAQEPLQSLGIESEG